MTIGDLDYVVRSVKTPEPERRPKREHPQDARSAGSSPPREPANATPDIARKFPSRSRRTRRRSTPIPMPTRLIPSPFYLRPTTKRRRERSLRDPDRSAGFSPPDCRSDAGLPIATRSSSYRVTHGGWLVHFGTGRSLSRPEWARFVDELKEFLRIASVSADPGRQKEMARAAEFVSAQLSQAGVAARVVPTEGHPIVFGEWLGAAGSPDRAVYGHYDVQPPDPLDQWKTLPLNPPFAMDSYTPEAPATIRPGVHASRPSKPGSKRLAGFPST